MAYALVNQLHQPHRWHATLLSQRSRAAGQTPWVLLFLGLFVNEHVFGFPTFQSMDDMRSAIQSGA